jgi:hypothetical protein
LFSAAHSKRRRKKETQPTERPGVSLWNFFRCFGEKD